MKIHDLYPAPGSTKKKKRVGRGPGSGHGKTSTKGHKGQHARSGGVKPPGFEGGQMPLILRIPKRGFTNPNSVSTAVFNIARLEEYSFPEGIVSKETLLDLGLIKRNVQLIKILGDGDPTKPYILKDVKLSRSAQDKIEKLGGRVVFSN
ncbi:MAG: 50S ribosomal protein L15 [Leptospirales bacterium]